MTSQSEEEWSESIESYWQRLHSLIELDYRLPITDGPIGRKFSFIPVEKNEKHKNNQIGEGDHL